MFNHLKLFFAKVCQECVDEFEANASIVGGVSSGELRCLAVAFLLASFLVFANSSGSLVDAVFASFVFVMALVAFYLSGQKNENPT